MNSSKQSIMNPNFLASIQRISSNTSNHMNLHKCVKETENAGTFPPESIDSISPETESLESPISLYPIFSLFPPSLLRHSILRMLLLPFIYHQISSTITPTLFGIIFQLAAPDRPSQAESPTPRSPSSHIDRNLTSAL